MEIVQKRFSNRTTFAFGERELKYTLRDRGATATFAVEYVAIPEDLGEFEERNTWYRNAGVFWVGLGILQIGMRLAEEGQLRGSLWLALGIVCLVAYRVGLTSYSTINTWNGRIFVIKGENHDRVFHEISARRKAQRRARFGTVDLDNDPASEIEKFRWLAEREAITGAECNAAIERISRHHGLPSGDPSGEEPRRLLN